MIYYYFYLMFIFKQAVARGLKDPSFRVIQNHFAISGNLGEVAAKVCYFICVYLLHLCWNDASKYGSVSSVYSPLVRKRALDCLIKCFRRKFGK